MTKEELEKEVEEYASSYTSDRGYYYEGVKEGFLDGLKAGRPKWHKVADGDIPKEEDLVLFKTDVDYYIGKIDPSKKLWWTGFCRDDSISSSFVIAWCEIPKYTEE